MKSGLTGVDIVNKGMDGILSGEGVIRISAREPF
jgi:hypothetical protein